MVEARLTTLLDRLEKLIERGEVGGAVAVAGAASAAVIPRVVRDYHKEVNDKVKAVKEAAAALNIPQVTTVTDQFTEVVYIQVATLLTLAKFKKPADFMFLLNPGKAAHEAGDLVHRKDFKAPPNHLKAVVDGYQLFQWPFYPSQDELRDNVKEFFGQIPFYGNKVIKLEKEADTKWYTAYLDLAQSVHDFLVERCDGIQDWTGKEDAAGAEAYFNETVEAVKGGNLPSGTVGAAGGAPAKAAAAPAGGKDKEAREYNKTIAPLVAALKASATALNIPQVTLASTQFIEVAEQQSAVLQTLGKFKKPENISFLYATLGANF